MPSQVFVKVNAHYTCVVEERPLYKQLSSAMSCPPPPERSKQATLFDLFRGASTSHEHDADHDSQSVTERQTIEPTAILNRCRPLPLISQG